MVDGLISPVTGRKFFMISLLAVENFHLPVIFLFQMNCRLHRADNPDGNCSEAYVGSFKTDKMKLLLRTD